MQGRFTRKPNVLLVDDDPGVRESVGLVLSERGAQVTPVASLQEARDKLNRRRYALVLTDLALPTGNEGLAVAKLARQRGPETKVVLFSGRDLDDVAEEATAAGVDELLAKPLSLDVLVRLLRDLAVQDGGDPYTPGNPGNGHRLSDDQGQQLLEGYLEGREASLDQIVEAYRPMVFSVFLRWFRLSTEDAEDLFQEVMLQLVLKAPQIRNVRTWLLGTSINQAKKRIRRLIRERNLAERYLENLELNAPEDTDDIREIVSLGLSQLRSSDRRLLSLIYVQGLSYQETADVLGRPIGSIGPLRGRALKRLSRAIDRLETPPKEMVA